MSDEQRGIYRKYTITRTDGSSEPGGKHESCAYFVLDLEHDPFAIPALKAYAKACRKMHPGLAKDIGHIVDNVPIDGQRFGPDGHSEMAHNLMARAESGSPK